MSAIKRPCSIYKTEIDSSYVGDDTYVVANLKIVKSLKT